MKDEFKHYHPLKKEQLEEIWNECLFVFDTNVLLDFYRLKNETSNSLIEVLESLKKESRIWIPYQVAYEYNKNRLNIIQESLTTYDGLIGMFESSRDNLLKTIEKDYNRHSLLNIDNMKYDISEFFKKITSDIKTLKEEHPNWFIDDNYLEKIHSIFHDVMGEKYTEAELGKVYDDGKKRFDNKIPPGFKDKDKPEPERYGDVVVWKQIIDKAKKDKKPIVFVTSDFKEDWVLKKMGKVIMPLPELRKEFYEEAGVDFHMYKVNEFLRYYYKNSQKDLNEDALNDINDLEKKRTNPYKIATTLLNVFGITVSQFDILKRLAKSYLEEDETFNFVPSFRTDITKLISMSLVEFRDLKSTVDDESLNVFAITPEGFELLNQIKNKVPISPYSVSSLLSADTYLTPYFNKEGILD